MLPAEVRRKGCISPSAIGLAPTIEPALLIAVAITPLPVSDGSSAIMPTVPLGCAGLQTNAWRTGPTCGEKFPVTTPSSLTSCADAPLAGPTAVIVTPVVALPRAGDAGAVRLSS